MKAKKKRPRAKKRAVRRNASRPPARMHLQSIMFARDKWDVRQAKTWARTHVCEIAGKRQKCRAGSVELTTGYIHLRQRDPAKFAPGSFRTIVLSSGEGVLARMGHLKGRRHV